MTYGLRQVYMQPTPLYHAGWQGLLPGCQRTPTYIQSLVPQVANVQVMADWTWLWTWCGSWKSSPKVWGRCSRSTRTLTVEQNFEWGGQWYLDCRSERNAGSYHQCEGTTSEGNLRILWCTKEASLKDLYCSVQSSSVYYTECGKNKVDRKLLQRLLNVVIASQTVEMVSWLHSHNH